MERVGQLDIWPLIVELGRKLAELGIADAARRVAEREVGESAPGTPAVVTREFAVWGDRLAVAGLGRPELEHLSLAAGRACVVVYEPWEITVNKKDERSQAWSCPFWKGSLEGFFGRTTGGNWSVEERSLVQPGADRTEFSLTRQGADLPDQLRRQLAVERRRIERDLVRAIDAETEARASMSIHSDEQSRRMLRERTRQLRHEIRERERIAKAKDELLAVVSHELRTPLTSLFGFTEILLNRSVSAERETRFLEVIHSEALRLSGIVTSFLAFDGLHSGYGSLELRSVDLKDAIDGIAELFSSKNRRVDVDIPPGLPCVLADEARLKQVFINLVSNAIKYSAESDSILVAAEARGGEVVTRIRDHGIGIPADEIRHLFTKFYRVDNADTRRVDGIGLGLTIAKEIVDAHEGRIWAESEPGRGSTFFVGLRVADESLKATSGTDDMHERPSQVQQS